MNNKNESSSLPTRILYTMIRVSNLERSIAFYQHALGMRELRRETFTEGRFTLVFLGYGKESSNTVIELTHNWDVDAYEHGTSYGHLALEVTDIGALCGSLADIGVKIVRAPGPMIYAAEETEEREVIAFIEDPDGYRIELIEK